MSSEDRISTADVDRAQHRVEQCKKAWAVFGSRHITASEISDAEAHTENGIVELRKYETFAWRKTQFDYGSLWLLQKLRLTENSWIVGGLISGTATTILAVIPVILICRDLTAIYISHAITFAIGFTAVSVLLWNQRSANVLAKLATLRTCLASRQICIVTIEQRLKGWNDHLVTLRNVAYAESEYLNSVEQAKILVDRLNSRRYRLKHCDWKSLRGIPFEDFVAEIFEELGYRVTKTKTTGDQGVDLVVKGKGRSIAVQTKGYFNSVGNKAVQEVYAGMHFYGCVECLAITNSVFTSGAINIAQSVGCQLIACQDFPRLIDGHIY